MRDPLVIAGVRGEVWSPAPRAHDRGVKLADYRRIASVTDIVMLASERPHAEHWCRAGAGWTVSDLVGDATLPLDGLGLNLKLRDIYAAAEA